MQNYHCSVIRIDGVGILIEGPAGSGKTALALGLMERAQANSQTTDFVTDDQALLNVRDRKLFAEAPDSIAGKVEIRGFGITEISHLQNSEIHVVVRLLADELIERMPDAKTTTIMDVEVPLLLVPTRHEEQAARIVLAWLKNATS